MLRVLLVLSLVSRVMLLVAWACCQSWRWCWRRWRCGGADGGVAVVVVCEVVVVVVVVVLGGGWWLVLVAAAAAAAGDVSAAVCYASSNPCYFERRLPLLCFRARCPFAAFAHSSVPVRKLCLLAVRSLSNNTCKA